MANEHPADPESRPEEAQDRAGLGPAVTEEAAAPGTTEAEAGSAQAAVEAPASTGEEEGAATDPAQAEIERLRAELEQAEARAEGNWQRVLRTEAEKDNVRKRAQKDIDSARKQALEKVANELLAVRDSLELGVDAARAEDADVAKVREGTELTLRMLTQAMEKFEIVQIDPVGEKFDPDYHQAMSMQAVEGYDSNTVYQVMQKGYRLGERLLRPALVMVAQ